MKRTSQHGFTLLELLVVVAILAMLAGAVIPMVTNSSERTQSSLAAANVTGLMKTIDSYWTYNGYYPDGWDTLIGTTDTGGAAGTALSTDLIRSLRGALTPTLIGTADPSAALWRSHINSFFYSLDRTTWSSLSSVMPSILPNDATSLPGTTFVLGADSSGTAISSTNVSVLTMTTGVATTDPVFNMLLNEWNLSATYIAAHNFIALGLGGRNELVGREMRSAPSIDVDSAALYYTRPIAVFAVPVSSTSTEKAKLVGMLGPDGRSLNQYLRNFHSPAP